MRKFFEETGIVLSVAVLSDCATDAGAPTGIVLAVAITVAFLGGMHLQYARLLNAVKKPNGGGK